MAKKLYYKIGEACKVLDIQPYVLRYWETEFPALSPSKSKSGQRTYTEDDLRVIGRIKELLYEEGFTIAGAKKRLEGEMAGAGLKPLRPLDLSGKAQKKKPAARPKEPEKAQEEPTAEEAVEIRADEGPAGSQGIEPLKAGIRAALGQVHEILDLLEPASKKR